MKKVLSILLAVLMIVAMIPTAFAANAPVITTSADKTTINKGDIVTFTVKVSANSKLCALTYEFKYNTSEFAIVSGSTVLNDVFGSEIVNTSTTPGTIKYVGASASNIKDPAQTILTFKLKALTQSGGKVTCAITEAYTASGGNNATNVTAAVNAASTKSITFKGSADYFNIRKPSRTSISYKDGIVLHVETVKDIPSNAKFNWTADNKNFKIEQSADGKTCTIIAENDGATTITVTLNTTNGILETETIEMTSKAGFFDKFIGFFRVLFGSTKIYSE